MTSTFVAASALVLACHALAIGLLPRRARTSSTVWCLLHALCNVVVARRTLPALLAAHAATGAWIAPHRRGIDYLPLAAGVLLHLYHSVAFPLTFDDRFHHVLFALIMGVPSVLYVNDAVNAMLFAVCGAPGALIYLTVVYKREVDPNVDEPRVSAAVNLLLRAPLVLGVNTAYARALRAFPDVRAPPAWAVGVQILLSTGNALYYAWQSWTRLRRKKKPPRPREE